MSAHHLVSLVAKDVGRPAVTPGFVAVQKGLGTWDISGDGDEQKSMTPVIKTTTSRFQQAVAAKDSPHTSLVQASMGVWGWSPQCLSTEAPLCAW